MKRSIKYALLAAMVGAPALIHAQQEVMVSQYMFNGLFLNPAYAGSHSYYSTSMLHRAQWMNVEGAPRTSLFAVDGPVMDGKMGVGLSVVHDQIGVTRDFEVAGHYAYRMRVSGNSHLSLGLKAGLSLYSARLNELVYWDANDQVFQADLRNEPVGKFGFGIYWHDPNTYIGLSVPTIYAADGQISMNLDGPMGQHFTQHYYLHAGRMLPLGEFFDVKLSTMIKYQPEAPVQADVNANFLYKERFWFGAGYRTGDAVVAMLEYQITPQLRAGYAYDMSVSRLRTFTSGGHEIMLGLDLGRELIKVKTPRYF
ncbi:MAG: type IX secretion system membrane protein PorP/SprF [Flavobacteriales bacterium]|nr:type IX secretion system membrane protein PorP/SprF [Flavobacteriales bacterium]